MLALRKTRPMPGVELCETGFGGAPLPPGEVEIAVAATGICGSDLHAVHWDAGYAFMAERLPVTIGHEFSGRVVASGEGVRAPCIGARVVCWPTVTCGACRACAAGRPGFCEARRIVGLHRDGAFAARVRVPAANCFPIPGSLPDARAALAEPLAIAINAVAQSAMEPGERVVVLGPGPIGLAIAWVATQRGARVLLVGLRDAARLGLAREMGIPHTGDLDGTTLADLARGAFGGAGIDRVIEATGQPVSVEEGLALLRPGGVLVAAGIHGADARIDLAGLVRGKKQLRGAHDTTRGAFEEAIVLLDSHGAALERMITHRFPLSSAHEAFEAAASGAAMKVLLLPDDISQAEGSPE